MSTGRADVLIVGGGQAGAQIAISLRASGYRGSIRILETGHHLPYERPPLTKAYLRGDRDAADLLLRAEGYWAQNGIDVRLGQQAVHVDRGAHEVRGESGDVFGYGVLVWAAGGHARQLPLGAGIRGVLSVRTLDDAEKLRAHASGIHRVAIIGGGFIGLEAAAVLRERGAEVTIIEAQERLLARVTSPPVSSYIAALHRAHGSDVRTGVVVEEILSEGGVVRGVRLGDGAVIRADLVLVGIGLVPNAGPLADSGLECRDGVDTDPSGRTADPDVYAAGDCANRVTAFSRGRRVRLESVPSAVEFGRSVAEAIAGARGRAEQVPWFWSHQFGTKLRTAGLFDDHDDLVVRGDPGAGMFSVVYLRDGVVIAIDCIDNARDFAQGKALVAAQVSVPREDLSDAALPLKALAARPYALVTGRQTTEFRHDGLD